MHVLIGKYQRHNLVSKLKGSQFDYRPTTTRVRAAVFNILTSSILFNDSFENLSVLDICCGNGGFGFESLSRGAEYVSFIDIHNSALSLVSVNAAKLKINSENFNIMRQNATDLPDSHRCYDIVYIDPPYNQAANIIPKCLEQLASKNWLKAGATVIIETSSKNKIQQEFEDFSLHTRRDYGGTKVTFLRYTLI